MKFTNAYQGLFIRVSVEAAASRLWIKDESDGVIFISLWFPEHFIWPI